MERFEKKRKAIKQQFIIGWAAAFAIIITRAAAAAAVTMNGRGREA